MTKIKKLIVLALYIYLISLSNLDAQESMDQAWVNSSYISYGLDVAVYHAIGENPDYRKLISDIRNDSVDGKELLKIYTMEGAAVSSFSSTPESNRLNDYPYNISQSDDLASLRWELSEDVILYYRGKIVIPEGYFALKLDDIDDKAWIYVYPDSGSHEDFRIDRPFVTNDVFFSFGKRSEGYYYFEDEKTYNIEIIYIQKKGDFNFNVEAVLGLKKEDIYLSYPTTKTIPIIPLLIEYKTDEQIDPQLTPSFLREASIKKAYRPLAKFKENMLEPDPDLYLHEKERRRLSKLMAQSEEENGIGEITENQPEAFAISPEDLGCFRGRMINIPLDRFPVQDEKENIRKEEFKRNYRGPYGSSGGYTSNNNYSYWNSDCPKCNFSTYMHKIINFAEFQIANNKEFALGYWALDKNGKYYDNNFVFNTQGNCSLNMDTDNFDRMNQDLRLFNLFRKFFDLRGKTEKSAIEKHEHNKEKGMDKIDKIMTGEDSKEEAQQNNAGEKFNKDKFRTFLRESLFMKLFKFSGSIRLPLGYIDLLLEDIEGASLVAFINRQEVAFNTSEEMIDGASIYKFPDSGDEKTQAHFHFDEKDNKREVTLDVYVFHYGGPFKFDLKIKLNEFGFLNLSEQRDYIIKEVKQQE